MKFAYLMHSYREFDELTETVNQLIRQGDHVFLMINDDDLRDKVYFVYAESNKVHISHTQEFAQEGDLSMARGTILQMKEAVEREDVQFDYYINLTDAMMPLKSREEIVDYLSQHPGNYFYIDRDETQDPTLRKKFESYYTMTNALSFRKGKITRGVTKGTAKLYHAMNIRRKVNDKIYIGSPYFILNHKAATILTNNYPYVSETFKLSWYAEEMYIPMMFEKWLNIEDHINDDLRALGPDGSWVESSAPIAITRDALNAKPNALFGGQISTEFDVALYEDYFDIYNINYHKEKEAEKEREIKVFTTK